MFQNLLYVAIVGIYTMVVTVILVFIIRAVTPMRVDEDTEVNGLDLAIHGERAYDITS